MTLIKFLFLLTLVSFVFGELIRFPILGFEIKPLDFSVVILYLSWLTYLIFKKRYSKFFYFPSVFFLIISIISLILNSFSLDPDQLFFSLFYLLRWASYVGVVVIVLSFDTHFKEKIQKYLIALGLVVVFLGYIQQIYYPNLRNLYYLGWDDHLNRMFSVFLDPNFAGAFFVLYLIFLLDLLFKTYKKRFMFFILSIISAITFYAIYLTYSRSALLMLIAGLLIFFIIKKMYILIGCAVIVLFTFTFLVPRAYTMEGTNLLRTASIDARLESARNALNIFYKNPIFGVGFNAYKFANERVNKASDVSGFGSHSISSADNSFIFVAATTGVVGLLAFFYFLQKILSINFDSALIVSSLIALSVDSLFVNSLFYSFLMFWFFVILGLRENR